MHNLHLPSKLFTLHSVFRSEMKMQLLCVICTIGQMECTKISIHLQSVSIVHQRNRFIHANCVVIRSIQFCLVDADSRSRNVNWGLC